MKKSHLNEHSYDFFMFLLGQVLSYENVRDIIKFCKEERLVLLADEVDMLTIVQHYSIIWLFFLGHKKLENDLSKEGALVKNLKVFIKQEIGK